MPISHHVILDTDIGSDVDDAMALAQLLGSDQVDLVGITTVYGDTLLRARLARRLASLAGRSIDVYAGCGAPLSGREVWWPGHEGAFYEHLERETVQRQSAVDFLVETVLARPGEIDVVAIGPLTNIAEAIRKDAEFAGAVKTLWVMGGAFSGSDIEHNFVSDSIAARVVFESPITAVVTGLEITRQVEIGRQQLTRIADAGPLGKALERDIHQWWQFWNEEWNVPHDPITVLTMTQPDLFTFSDVGQISIADDGVTEGQSSFVAGASGSTRTAVALDPTAVSEQIVQSIVRASTDSATALL